MEGSGRICTITGFPDLVGAAEAPGEPANGDTATGGCGLPVGVRGAGTASPWAGTEPRIATTLRGFPDTPPHPSRWGSGG